MAETTHVEMHHDHQHWFNDSAMWRDDLELWKQEAQKALANLVRLEAPLRQTITAIQDREKDVHQHIARIKLHENSLCDFEHTGQGDPLQLLTLAKAHPKEIVDHQQQQLAHAQLKNAYHTVMAHWNALLRELTSEEREPAHRD